MRKPLTPVLQWLLVAAFVAWSTIVFVVIVGEDSPEMQLSLFDFFLLKVMGLCSAYSTYKAGEWFYRRSYFPDIVCKYIEESAKDVEDEEL